jgi:hypothetical protein
LFKSIFFGDGGDWNANCSLVSMLHAGGASIPHLHNLALALLKYWTIVVGLL